MKITNNLIANYLINIWNIISTYIFLPLYLRYLGEENYGIVMLSVVIYSMLALLDVGFSTTLRRELAKNTQSEKFINESISLLKSIELFYLGILFLVVIICYLLSDIIAYHWINVKSTNETVLKWVIILIAINAILQIISSMYNNGILALGEQVTSSKMQFIYTLLRNGLVIIIILNYPLIINFFLWQTSVVIAYLFIQRQKLIKIIIGKNYVAKKILPDLSKIKNVFYTSISFFTLSILSIINLQIDKIIISKLLTIKDVGYYSTAFAFSQIIVSACGPIAIATFPQLMQKYTQGNLLELKKSFHFFSKITSILIGALGMSLLVNSNLFLEFWLGDKNYVSKIEVFINYMIFSSIFLASQIIPYNIAIVSGKINSVIRIVTLNVVITIPAYYLSIESMGLKGAAHVWFISNFFMLILNVYFYIKDTLTGEYIHWLLRDWLLPIIASGGIVFILGQLALKNIPETYKIIYLVLTTILTITFLSFILFKSKLK